MERIPASASSQSEIAKERLAASAAALAGCCVAAVGAIVLLGWVLDIRTFKSIYGPITMKSNAAVALLACGGALWAHSHRMWRVGSACAALGSLIGALTLSQHLFGWDLHIDEILFREPAGAAGTVSPNRMGPNASTNLMLAGVSLLLLFRGTARAISVAQALSVTCLLLATLAVAGYMYGATQLYAVARYTGIALHTAIALAVLDAGILAARVDAGPMSRFVADGPAGTLLRRLFVPVILTPLVIGYFVILGRQADLYDRALSVALFAVSVVIVLGATVWRTAKVIEHADEGRRRAEHDRDLLLVRERRARDEAESASRLKDHFIAMLSHELRTPLNVMLGWTRVLETKSSAERHARAAAVVARNGRLLARLVEDLLDISRVSSGQLEIAPRPMVFNAVVQASVEALAPAAAEKGVQVVAHLDPTLETIMGDPERIQQIVSNLLSNAVKFTNAGGQVELRTRREGGSATLIVTDTGEGFDEAFQPQLFQPFRQADTSSRREHGGLGLGLSIARHIAELHGGTITGWSGGRGRGACFTLTIPVITADAAPLRSPEQTVLGRAR